MLASVKQAFVGRSVERSPLRTTAWEANDLFAALI